MFYSKKKNQPKSLYKRKEVCKLKILIVIKLLLLELQELINFIGLLFLK